MLVLAAAAALAAAVTYNVTQDFQHSVHEAKQQLRTLAAAMVTNTAIRARTLDRALDVLAKTAFAESLAPSDCATVLQSLVSSRPGALRAFTTDTEGRVLCESSPDTTHLQLGLSTLQRKLASKPFVLTAPVATDDDRVVLASTLISTPAGQARGALHLVASLSALDPNIPSQFLPENSRYGTLAGDGTLLWRNLDPEGAVGRKPATEAARRILEVREGDFEAVSIDGVTRFFSVAPVPSLDWIVYVGVPATSVTSQPLRRAITVTVAAVIVISLLVVIAVLQAQRIVKPITALEQVATKVGSGDLSARAEVTGPREVVAVARALNDMVAARRRSDELVNQAFGASPIGVALGTLDGQYLRVNAAFANMLGRTEAELCSMNVRDVTHPDDVQQNLEVLRELIDGTRNVYQGEKRYLHRDGHVLWAQLNLSLVHDAAGNPSSVVAQIQDIGERKRVEAASRLAVVGTLAAGAAHEINNPLTYVLSNLSWAAEELKQLSREKLLVGTEEVIEALNEAHEGATRVATIVSGLKSFARQTNTLRAPTDVAAAMRKALQLTQTQLDNRAKVDVQLDATPAVMANAGELEQVFVNLLVNAVQAIPEGRSSSNRIGVTVRLLQGSVVAEVSDTGTGMNERTREHLFEPFFTTKPVGTGTGLGLPICHGIVTSFGGRIEVESELGKGSTLRVVLPSLEGKAKTPAKALWSALPKDKRVMVVDDDPLVARAMARALGEGPEVVIVTDPNLALERLVGGERVDLSLCDVMMPGLSGEAFQAALAKVSPALAASIIFITGGAFTQGATDFLAKTKNRWVQKPVETNVLRELVHDALKGG
ncbi:MAG: PAS domain S-box protein [Archangiaceae bacterium]|nr:PAS domain S-box protein [Archangiaceae bacterium]